MSINEYRPDWVSPPSDTIKELIKGDSTNETLAICDLTGISEVVNNDAPITEDIAKWLKVLFGGTTQFWLNRERNYRDGLKRLAVQDG